MISTNTRIVAIAGSLALLIFVIELVRRRRLKEEYSALWVIVATVLLVLAAWGGLLHSLTHAIGAVSESSTLFLFGLLFIILLLLNFSVRVSLLERRLTALVQEIALLTSDRQPPTPRREALADPDASEAPDTRAPPPPDATDDAPRT
jgi:hypothetical protein